MYHNESKIIIDKNVDIQLTLPYPISVNRYWRTGKNGTYISQEGLNFKNEVYARYAYRQKLIVNNVKLDITIHPKLTLKGKPYKILIDLDNGLKSILDSLNNVIYYDDKQVKEIHIKYGNPIIKGAVSVKVNYLEQ